jgi:hypothetical protein
MVMMMLMMTMMMMMNDDDDDDFDEVSSFKLNAHLRVLISSSSRLLHWIPREILLLGNVQTGSSNSNAPAPGELQG